MFIQYILPLRLLLLKFIQISHTPKPFTIYHLQQNPSLCCYLSDLHPILKHQQPILIFINHITILPYKRQAHANKKNDEIIIPKYFHIAGLLSFYLPSFKRTVLISGCLNHGEYNNLLRVEQKSNMNSLNNQSSFTHFDFMPHRFSIFLCSFQHQQQFKDQSKNFIQSEQGTNNLFYPLQQVQTPSFQSRIEPSIILQSSPKVSPTATTKHKKIKHLQKTVIIQKQSRNVLSNLLRIFLKNILEARYFDSLIQKSIKKYSFSCDLKEFHQWLHSFNINYKNYIRLSQVKRLFSQSHNLEMHKIIRILVSQYCCDVGARHCLTSRRIDRASINMHLRGLRQLILQLHDK